MMAVMQQTLKPGNIFKIGEILDIANKYLETNNRLFLYKRLYTLCSRI